MVRFVTTGGELSNADPLQTLSEERRDRKKTRDVAYKSRLKGLSSNIKGNKNSLILRAKITGAWLSIRGTTVSGTVISATEFWDFKCARYNISPIKLQSHCDRCVTSFGVTHALNCSIGSLAIARKKIVNNSFIYTGVPYLIICTRQNPNISGPYQIRDRYTSG